MPSVDGRHCPVPEDRLGVAGAQHVQSSMQSAPSSMRTSTTASRTRRARTLTKLHGRVEQRLKSQPAAQRDRHHQARVDDDTLIIKRDIRSVRQTVHHAGDPLMQDRSRWHGRTPPACAGKR